MPIMMTKEVVMSATMSPFLLWPNLFVPTCCPFSLYADHRLSECGGGGGGGSGGGDGSGSGGGSGEVFYLVEDEKWSVLERIKKK